MKKYALLVMLLLTSNFAIGQEIKSPVVLEKVNDARSFPEVLRAYIPNGGNSRFWGETKLKYEGEPVWVHIYNVARADFSEGREKYGARDYAPDERNYYKTTFAVSQCGVQKSGVDLFVLPKGNYPKRISSTYFVYQTYGGAHLGGWGGSEKVEINNLWLDPRTKKIPIFEVDLRGGGVMGDIGVEMLIIFPNGLSKGAVKEGFGYGADNSYQRNGWESSFNSIDPQGLLEVKAYFVSTKRGSIREEKRTLYRWKDNYFRPSTVKIERSQF